MAREIGSARIPAQELLTPQDVFCLVAERIIGERIEGNLLTLAKVGGTQIDPIAEQPIRYAVNRVALSEADKLARETVIKPWMQEAGMTLLEHPFGLIGTYHGTDPTLPPLVILSHTDSVPKADMYDGVTGVVGGIEVVKAIHSLGMTPKRSIMVISLTGEESSGFGFALFGSRGMFHGLTEKEFDSRNPGGESIREVLGEEDAKRVSIPIFGPRGADLPTPYVAVELHVEQDKKLDEAGVDLGVVEAIAAPIRYQVQIGDTPLEADSTIYPFAKYLQLRVEGKTGHSGATPMGNRADGLVTTARFLLLFLAQQERTDKKTVTIGDLIIEEQAINKIPGITQTLLRITGESREEVNEIIQQFNQQVAAENSDPLLPTRFYPNPISLEEVETPENPRFFKPEEVSERQQIGFSLILATHRFANMFSDKKVVGTVGTYTTTPEGKIVLALDIRGINQEPRDQAIEKIKQESETAGWYTQVNFGDRLAGSGDPVVLDPTLVKTTQDLINANRIATSQVMFSAAGHDSQNTARAGIPTVMIFCQSNKGGIAHHPDAWTDPKNLEKGVRALAALTLKLTL